MLLGHFVCKAFYLTILNIHKLSLFRCQSKGYNDYFGIYILNDSAYYDDKLGLNLDAIGGEGVFY